MKIIVPNNIIAHTLNEMLTVGDFLHTVIKIFA